MAHFTHRIAEPAGPLLQAAVVVSAPRRKALQESDQDVPQAVPVQSVVDTGASATCVDPTVLEKLKLNPTGSVDVHTPSTAGTPETFDQFDVGLVIPGSEASHVPLRLETISVLAADRLASQGYEVLIGRDILADCILVYNGPTESFTLAF